MVLNSSNFVGRKLAKDLWEERGWTPEAGQVVVECCKAITGIWTWLVGYRRNGVSLRTCFALESYIIVAGLQYVTDSSYLLVFMLLHTLLPHRLFVTKRVPRGDSGWFLRISHERHCSFLVSWIPHSGRIQLPCCEDTLAVLCRDPHGKKLRLHTNNQPNLPAFWASHLGNRISSPNLQITEWLLKSWLHERLNPEALLNYSPNSDCSFGYNCFVAINKWYI